MKYNTPCCRGGARRSSTSRSSTTLCEGPDIDILSVQLTLPSPPHCRHACSIELATQVILTGGRHYPRGVAVYTSIGFVEDLPELGAGRRDHACGHFVNTENTEVVR